MADGVGIGAGLGDLIGGIYNLVDPGRGPKQYYQGELGLWQEMPLPEYDDTDLIAPFLTSTGEMTPEVYDAIVTGDLAQIEEDPALREAQLRQLLGMEQIAREGLPLQDRLLADEAQRAVAGEFSRANENIIRNLAARGRAGGGTELAARLAAAGNAAEMARGMGSDLARESIANRIMAMREAEGMGGRIRGQDVNTANLNSQMANRFTEWLSGLKTTAAMNAARARERAQDYNVRNRQRLSDTNRLTAYDVDRENLSRRNDLADRLFRARIQRATGMTGAYRDLAEAQAARQAAKQANVRSVAGGTGSIVDSLLAARGGGAGGAGVPGSAGASGSSGASGFQFDPTLSAAGMYS